MQRSSAKSAGFTLVELAVVLLVVGLMVGFGMQAAQVSTSVDCYAKTRAQMVTIKDALQRFADSNGRLPTPAGRIYGVTDPNYGREAAGAAIYTVASGTVGPNNYATNPVLMGALPFQALQLPTSFATDCWGNKFSYLVGSNFTTTAGYTATTDGPIEVRRGTLSTYNAVTTKATYAIISHGSDALGAVRGNATGSQGGCPVGSRIDSENCDFTNGVLYFTDQNNGTNPANFSDDLVSYGEKISTPSNVYCWGNNNQGQLGNGSLTNSNVPVPITLPTGVTAFTAVSGGYLHSCGIGNNGRAYCWGWNNNGQLGNGTIGGNSATPVAVTLPSGVTAFTAVIAGGFHSCGIGNDNRVYCWGWGVYGQLGNGSWADSATPVAVTLPSGVTSFASVSVGLYHNCGIGNDGRAYCWGQDGSGQLGIGSWADSAVPAAVTLPSGVTSFTAVNAGYYHSCGFGNDGRAYCWGGNSAGQLGNGSTTISNVPVQVTLPSGVTSFITVSGGGYHNCAIGNNGRAYCSGQNSNGQLGNGTTTNSTTPVSVTLPSGVTSFAVANAGYYHSCGLGNNGRAYCWGLGDDGQLGNGTNTNSSTALPVTLPSGVTSLTVSTGGRHSCGLANSGACNNATPLGCITGTATADNGQTSCGTIRTWVCAGSSGGSNSGTCSYNNAACATPVNGACNNSTPLGCSAGTATSDNGQAACTQTRTWVCAGANGGSNSGTCSYTYGACPLNGVCNNSTPLGCSQGGAFNDNGQTGCGQTRQWQCSGSGGGSNSGTCSIANAACAVNGVCNNAVALGCSAGSATSDNGQTACGTTRQWVCAGQYGGSNSGTCSFANAACAVNGVCNNAVALGCVAGSPASDDGQTACGTNRTWVCTGSGGGSNSGTCSFANGACGKTWVYVGQYASTNQLIATTLDSNCGAVEGGAGCLGCTSFPAVNVCNAGDNCGTETRPCLRDYSTCTMDGGQTAGVWQRYECQ